MSRPIPPEGWEYVPVGERRLDGYMYWDMNVAQWKSGQCAGAEVCDTSLVIRRKDNGRVVLGVLPKAPDGWRYAMTGQPKPRVYMYWGLGDWIPGENVGDIITRNEQIIEPIEENKMFNVYDEVETACEIRVNRGMLYGNHTLFSVPDSIPEGSKGKVDRIWRRWRCVDFGWASVWVSSKHLCIPKEKKGGAEMPKYWRAKEGVRGLHSGAIVELVDVREFLYVRGSNGPSTVYEYCPKESLEPLTVPPEVAAILEKAEKEINELCSMEGDEMISLMRRTVLAAVGVK